MYTFHAIQESFAISCIRADIKKAAACEAAAGIAFVLQRKLSAVLRLEPPFGIDGSHAA